MVYEIIKCPYCQSEHIVRYGKSKSGKQKYKCCNENCHKIFQLEYQYKACEPGIKEKVWAVEHKTNTPLAYIFGTREHKYLVELLKLLSPFNIVKVYADNNFAYSNKISSDKLVTGKRNTQQIERNHLTLRTRIKRLARKTICFSKSKELHETVIGIFINTFFFRRQFSSSTF